MVDGRGDIMLLEFFLRYIIEGMDVFCVNVFVCWRFYVFLFVFYVGGSVWRKGVWVIVRVIIFWDGLL